MEYGDLISRQDALSCFHDWIDQYGDVHAADEITEYRMIEQLASVEPGFDTVTKIDKAHDDGYKQGYLQGKADYERKKGKWIPTQNPQWKAYYHDKCSVCGWWNTKNAVCRDSKKKAHSLNYCPNCGAKMRGEDDG